MSEAESPYGDGRASARIVEAFSRWFKGERPLLEDREQFQGSTLEHLEVVAA
jgi:hypothetical protein